MGREQKGSRGHLIGVVSDTHGLVRPGLLEALSGVEMIIHAGDVGGHEVLEALRTCAPVVAVRGNMDGGPWARGLRETEVVEIGGCLIYVLHDADRIDLDPAAAGFRAVISGHSHRPSRSRRKGVLFLNPGSAGPRRFRLPVSASILRVEGESIESEFLELED
jgi:putative phosphoesterase